MLVNIDIIPIHSIIYFQAPIFFFLITSGLLVTKQILVESLLISKLFVNNNKIGVNGAQQANKVK